MYVSLITYTMQRSRRNPVSAKGAPECTTEVPAEVEWPFVWLKWWQANLCPNQESSKEIKVETIQYNTGFTYTIWKHRMCRKTQQSWILESTLNLNELPIQIQYIPSQHLLQVLFHVGWYHKYVYKYTSRWIKKYIVYTNIWLCKCKCICKML